MTLTVEGFDNGEIDLETVDAVANSKDPNTGAPADTWQTRRGDQTDTLQGRLSKLGVIFDDPIRDYAAGLLIEDLRAHRYPAGTGDIYIPKAPLPFTTGASFDPNDWLLYSGLGEDQVSQLVAKSAPLAFSSVINLKAGQTLGGYTIDPSLIDANDISATTQGYSGAWAALKEPQGGGLYVLTTLQRVRDAKGNPAWVPDELGDHYLFSGTDYVAVLLIGDSVSMLSFGVEPESNIDQSAKLQACVNSGARDITGSGMVSIANSISVPIGIQIEMQPLDSGFKPIAGGTFVNDFMFLFNSDGSAPIVPFTNINPGGMRNVYFHNEDQILVKGVLAYGSYEFSDIRGRYMHQLIKRGGGAYSDSFKVQRVYIEPVLGTEYQIECVGLGDGLLIEEVHAPYNPVNPGDGTPNAVSVSTTLGGKISDGVGGNIRIANGAKITVDGGHYERAQAYVERSNVDFVGTYFGASNKVPIYTDDGADQSYEISVSDCEFGYLGEGVYDWNGADIHLDPRFTLTVKNSYRRYTVNGSLDKSQLSGVLIEDVDSNMITEWKNHSFMLSRFGQIFPGNIVDKVFTYSEKNLGFDGVTASTDTATTWAISSGTYYYTTQLYSDVTRRIGRNQLFGEAAAVVTNGGSGARLDISYGSKPGTGLIRVYRGVAPGVYGSYVDIPIISMNRMYDNGLSLNGFTWLTRTPTGKDDLNNNGTESVQYCGDNVVIKAVASPTTGSFNYGDRVERTGPAASGFMGFVYVITDEWKEYGAIET